MVRPKRLLALLPALVACVAMLGGCKSRPPTLEEISGVEALKTQFNADAGKPRIILLLSPT
jgi:hypothetical protein